MKLLLNSISSFALFVFFTLSCPNSQANDDAFSGTSPGSLVESSSRNNIEMPRNDLSRPSLDPNAPRPAYKVKQQNHAYMDASELNSWFGLYMKEYGTFGDHIQHKDPRDPSQSISGKDKRALLQQYLNDCFNENNDCNDQKKQLIVQGAIQNNLGEQVRSHILQMNSANERIKSIRGKDIDDLSELVNHTAKNDRQAFRLNPNEVTNEVRFDDGKTAKGKEQLAMLGDEFLRQYKDFIRYYGETTVDRKEWHYVAAKNPSSDGRTIMETSASDPGTPLVDEVRFNQNRQSQAKAKPFLDKFVNDLEKPTIEKTPKKGPNGEVVANANTAGLKLEEAGLTGARVFIDPKDGKKYKATEEDPLGAAKAIVRSINSRVDEAVMRERQKQSNIGKNIVIGTQINLTSFSQFLDEIWPPTIKKPERQVAAVVSPPKP